MILPFRGRQPQQAADLAALPKPYLHGLSRVQGLIARRRAVGLKTVDDPAVLAVVAGLTPDQWTAFARLLRRYGVPLALEAGDA